MLEFLKICDLALENKEVIQQLEFFNKYDITYEKREKSSTSPVSLLK